jgi:hypothetical protein
MMSNDAGVKIKQPRTYVPLQKMAFDKVLGSPDDKRSTMFLPGDNVLHALSFRRQQPKNNTHQTRRKKLEQTS